MTAGAIIGSGILGAGASIFGSKKAADAQRDAANQSLEMQRAQLALQRQMYEQGRSDLAPYRDLGQASINPLMGLAGMSGNPAAQQQMLQSLPGYQFALQQGLRAAQGSATRRGLGLSGAAIKGAEQFATGLADQTFGNQFNRLLGLTQLGQNAAGGTANLGQNYAGQAGQTTNAMSQLYGNIGDASAAQYNAMGGAFGNVANSVTTAMLLNRLMPQMQNPGIYSAPNINDAKYNQTNAMYPDPLGFM